MNKLVFVLGVAIVACGALAADDAAASGGVRRRQPRPILNPGRSGGIVERKQTPPSKSVAVVNSQKTVASEKIAEMVKSLRLVTKIPIEVDAKDAPVSVEVVEVDGTPTLAIYPEDFRAVVNVKKLAEDGAAKDVVEARVKSEIARATLFLLGAGYPTGRCLAMPVRSVKDLDGLSSMRLSPETLMHLNACSALGIHQLKFVDYRRACQEGWAPEPDTEIRKKIWEEVHAIPDKPLKIEYKPQSGK